MACCALAAFVVSQLLLGIDWLRERLGLTAVVVAPSASAAWRLGDAPPPSARVFAPRRLALALAAGSFTFALGYVSLDAGADQRPHALQIPYLCTSASPLASE